MVNPLEILKFVESAITGEAQQLNALALLAEAPSEDFAASIRLPVQNELPAYQLGNNGLGSTLANTDYGIAAPVPGQAPGIADQSIGELLTGDLNGL